jgi:hypothetical protein
VTQHRVGRVIVTVSIRKFPDELGTVSYDFSTQAIPGSETAARPFGQRRVIRFDDVTRALSSLEGQYEVPSWGLRLDDTDGLLRGLLADPTTNLIDQGRWEVTAAIRSEDGLGQGLDPVLLFRGLVTDATPEEGRAFSLRAKDLCGGHLKGFDLDALTPMYRLVDYFGTLPGFPEANANAYASLVYGENSDHGTVDLAGNNAEKGLVPPKYVGKTLISDGLPGTPPTAPTYLDPPLNLTVNVVGSGPTHQVACGVAAISHFGETTMTYIVVPDYPLHPSGSHYAEWEWDAPVNYPDETIAYALYVLDGGDVPQFFLDGPNNDGTFVNPETTYTDDGDDNHFKTYRHGPVGVNTAQVAPGAPGVPGSGPMFYDTWIVSSGVLNWDVVDFYGAVLGADGGLTKRGLLNASTPNSGLRNSEIITPLDDLWPHDDPWIERDGVRFSGFYSRGAISTQALNGNVGLALSIGGYTANPDGTGLHFTQAGPCLLHCLTNWWGLDPETPVYSNGASWNDYPRFANGDSKLKVSSFAQFQTDTATAMGTDGGAQCRFVLTKPITLREFFSKAAWTFYARWRVNHFGQLGLFRNPHGLSATGTLYRDRIEIRRWYTPILDRKVATFLTYVYDYDAEMEQYRRADATVQDDTLIGANDGQPQPRERIEMPFTGDPATAQCSAYYWLALFRKPRRFQPFELSYRGLAKDLGDPFRVTHYDGLGASGELGTQMILDRHTARASSERTVFVGLDVSQLQIPTIPGLSPLGDEDEMSVGNLGDEEALVPPPTGAYELVDEDA